MSQQFLMGVDVGTQSAKVVIFDLTGQVVCGGDHPLRRLSIPAPLLAEHPDDDLWDSLVPACNKAMAAFRKAGHDPGGILAMGLCVIRCCRVLLKADGTLANPVINWMDRRLNTPFEPEETYGPVRYVTTASGYLTLRLTGEQTDTCANHIGAWPMDNDTWDWHTDPEVHAACHLTRDMLFDVVLPGSVLGRVTADAARITGLPAGLPVVATAHDKAVEALGAGSLEPGTCLISLGTYIGAMVHGRENRPDARHFWPFMAAIPGRYLYECMGVRRGMWTISWFCDQFGDAVAAEAGRQGLSVENLFNREAAQVPAGCEGLITIHDWAPPADAIFRKGVMLGFDGRHTRAHIFRSLLEGIMLTLKNHVDPMMTELGTGLDHLVISGGGAGSDVLMQIFADGFGIPVSRCRVRSAAAVGCAISAGMASGVFDSYGQAVQQMMPPRDNFSPDPSHQRFYRDLNRMVYQQVNRHLDPLLESLSHLVDTPP